MRIVTFAIIWTLFALHALPAAAQTLSDDIRMYDFEGLGWSMVVSFTGGSFATLISLLADKSVVLNAWRELVSDLVIAAMAGFVAYVLLAAIVSLQWVVIPSAVKMAVLFFAGWSRQAFIAYVNLNGARLAQRGAQWAADRIKTEPKPQPQPDPEPKEPAP